MALVLGVFMTTLYLLLWHFPLLDLGSLLTPDQDENFNDQNFYLYVASKVCAMKIWTEDDITVTWSATGVIGYLTYGCKTFGSVYFYLLANPVMTALGLLAVLWSSSKVGLRPKPELMGILALPYTWLTLATPGKECLSVFGTMLFIAGLMLVHARIRWLAASALIALGLTISSLNRLHEAGMLLAFAALWLTGTTRRPVRLLILVAVGSVLAGPLLDGVRLNQGAESLTDELLWSGSSEGKAVDLDGFFALLRSDNLFVHALLGLPRVLVVLSSPLSSFITPPTPGDLSYFVFRDLTQRLRLIDFGLIATVLWQFVRHRNTNDDPISRMRSMIPTFFFFMLYVISFFGVSQKSRYIFQYTPLLLSWYWMYGAARLVRPAAPATSIATASQPS